MDEKTEKLIRKIVKETKEYIYDYANLEDLTNKILIENGYRKQCKTLREYIKENESGAYHHFWFYLNGNIEVNVIGIDEFKEYYNEKLLDSYIVLEDIKTDNGGDCTSYYCLHKLTIERIK